jgi:hypothetical protein
MGKCPNCYNIRVRIKYEQCVVCGKEGCARCFVPLLNVIWGDLKSERFLNSRLFVCSEKCLDSFIEMVGNKIGESRVDINETQVPAIQFIDTTLSNNDFTLKDQVREGITQYPLGAPQEGRFHNYNNVNQKLLDEIQRIGQINRAKLLLIVRRFEDAAQIYEQLRLYEEAGKARYQDQQVSIKKTEIFVDLNALIKQIKDGAVVVYCCPHCKAPITINNKTKTDELKHCNYCKTAYDILDITDVQRKTLS